MKLCLDNHDHENNEMWESWLYLISCTSLWLSKICMFSPSIYHFLVVRQRQFLLLTSVWKPTCASPTTRWKQRKSKLYIQTFIPHAITNSSNLQKILYSLFIFCSGGFSFNRVQWVLRTKNIDKYDI